MAVNINVPSQVKTYANLAAFPATGALKTIYIAEDTNKTYRWTGSVYTEISASAAMTWGAIGGTLSNQTDLQSALDAKVPTSRTLTINGVTQDLSANRTFTISTGITIGSTAIASGTIGRILFEGAGNVVQESGNLFWDNTNGRLGIGTSSPLVSLDVNGVVRANTLRSDVLNNFANTITLIQFSGTGNRLFDNSGTQVVNLRGGNIQIGTTTDAGFRLDVNGTARVQGLTTLAGTMTASGAIARNQLINGTLVAAANNDVLVGLDINPTYSLGAFTGTSRIGARIQNSRFLITGTYSSLSSEGFNPDALVQLDATINGRNGSKVIAFRINPTINVNNAINQTFSALEVSPTFQNVGSGSSTYAINSIGPNLFGTINVFGAQTTFLGQGGTSTYHYVGTIPNGQGFKVQVNSNIAGYSFDFDGSGIPTYTLRNNNINALQVRSTGNVLINTTTDAGFRLDVNGTARVQTSIQIGTGSLTLSGSTISSNTMLQIGGTGGTMFTQNFLYFANSTNFELGYWIPNNDTKSGITIGGNFTNAGAGATSVGTSFRFNTGIATTVGNVTLNNIAVTGAINATGGTTTFRGFYYNPTLTSLTGTTHFAFHSTSGRIRFENLPTSSAGLSAGDIWNDAGTLKIV